MAGIDPWKVIGPSKPTPKQLGRYVIPRVAAKWHELGIELYNDDDVFHLDTIQKEHPGDFTKACTEMFKFWGDTYKRATWKKLINALKAPGLQLNNIAAKIKKDLETAPADDDSDDDSDSSGAPTPAVEKSSSAPAVDKLSKSVAKFGEKRKTTFQNEDKTDAKKWKKDNSSVDKEPTFSLESLQEKYQKAISVGYTKLRYDKLSAQQKKILDEVQAMLVVVNKSEFMATMSYLKPLVNHDFQSILEIHHVMTLGHKKNSLVFFIGMFGKCPVAVTRVNQGCGRDALYHSGCFNNILLIAAVGVAAGFPENGVNLGDVIVSQQITDCSIYKKKNGDCIPRGNTTPAFEYLVDRLKTSELQWEFECASQGTKSSVKFGLFLSKPVLLDDKEEREKMLEYFGKEAKGYEMEGFSIAAGAIDCIIVKGVCDFACDKDKTWQPTAALAAIDCLHNDLDKMDLSLMKDFIQKASPDDDSDDHSGSSGAPTPAVEKSSSAPTVDKLSEKPQMADLNKIVLTKVMVEWEDLAEGFRYDGAIIAAIKERNCENSKKCCQDFFRDWLGTNNGKGAGPKTWSTLFDIIKNHTSIASEIREEMITKVKTL